MKATKSITSIVLYVLAVILLIVGSTQLFQSTSFILDSINQGTLSWGSDFATIISYISQACVSTYSFAIIFYIIAKMYPALVSKNVKEKE